MPTVIENPPVTPISKHEFNIPLDMLDRMAELKGIKLPIGAPLPPMDLKAIEGTWTNVDANTRGLVKLIVNFTRTGLTVHGFGACVPTPCDWGVVPARAYAETVCTVPAVGFTAQYNFKFKETLIVGRLEFGALFVETFDHFIDGSGREDYSSVYILSK